MAFAPPVENHGRVRVTPLFITVALAWVAGQILALPAVSVAATLAGFHGKLSQLLAASTHAPWWVVTAALVAIWIGFLGGVVVAHRWAQVPRWRGAWRFRLGDVKFMFLGVACQIAVGLAYLPFHSPTRNQPTQHLFGASHGAAFVLVALLSVIGAPLVEEMFFRGTLFGGLASVAPTRTNLVLAVAVSSALFGAAHVEWFQFPGLAAMGAVLAIVAWRTKRLAPAFITHAAFNAVALLGVIAQRVHH